MLKIPIKDTLITTHRDPDADALASSKALAEYLKSKGKKAAIRVSGTTPSHLEWIVANEELVSSVPEWVKQIVVLDCEPSKERVGWQLPDNIPVINIDHHSSRIGDNNLEKCIYVLNRCSTASALLLDFNISHPILLAGLYGDTFFVKSLMSELLTCFKKLSKTVDDEIADKILSCLKPTRDRRVIDTLREAKVRHCRNGFIIFQTKDNEDPGVIEEVMRTLNGYNESVCLIQPNGSTRLRTRNPNVDVSKIAEFFGGGGHLHAAGCILGPGKASALKTLIISLDVKPIEVDPDLVIEQGHDTTLSNTPVDNK